MKFSIYHNGGSTAIASGRPEYNGTFGQPASLTFSEICSPTPIAWAIGDFVDYTRTGLRYRLYDIPEVTKQARRGQAGDSFVYKNVTFYADTKGLSVALFRDVVMDASKTQMHFSSVENASTYEDVTGIARRLQKNMDDYVASAGSPFNVPFKVKVYRNLTVEAMARANWPTAYANYYDLITTAKEFSFSSGSTCLDALDQIYKIWKGIGWVHYTEVESGVTYNVIHIGRPNIVDSSITSSPFLYGKGKGLTSLRRAVSTKTEFANRIYPFGSERNLPSRYYNTLETATPILDQESIYVPNLMINPYSWKNVSVGGVTYKDPAQAYVEDSPSISKYGLREAVIYFDGNNDTDEIYPSIKGKTIKDVKDAKDAYADETYYPTLWQDTERVDMFASVPTFDDDGYLNDETGEYYRSREVKDDYSVNNNGSKVYPLTKNYKGVSVPLFQKSLLTANSTLDFELNLGNTILSAYSNAEHTAKHNIDSASYVYLVITYTDADGKAVTRRTNLDYAIRRSGDVYLGKSGNVNVVMSSVAVGVGTLSVAVSAYIELEDETIGSFIPNITGGGSWKVSLKDKIDDSFTVKLKQIGFDIGEYQVGNGSGIATIAMTSGKCAGREFSIKKGSVKYNLSDDSWTVVCYRQKDDSLNQVFPNSTYNLTINDTFVLIDLMMPPIYIGMAETELVQAANAKLKEMSQPQFVYEPDIDAIKQLSYSGTALREGMYLQVKDEDIIPESDTYHGANTQCVLVNSIVISEKDDAIPTYKVTLMDEKRGSFFSQFVGEVGAQKKVVQTIIVDGQRQSMGVQTASVQSVDEYNGPITDDQIPETIARKTDLDAYVPVAGETDVTGKKTFTAGLDFGVGINPTVVDSISIGSTNRLLAMFAKTANVEEISLWKDSASIKMVYDKDHNAVHIIGNVYADGFVSAGGVGSGGSGGGGSVVSVSPESFVSGVKIGTISIDATPYELYAPKVEASAETITGSKVKVATISINGNAVPVYAPVTTLPSWIGDTKPSYSFSEITGILSDSQIPSNIVRSRALSDYALKSELGDYALKSELSAYVTIATEQTITGKKTFTGGLVVSGTDLEVEDGGLTIDGSTALVMDELGNLLLGSDLDVRVGFSLIPRVDTFEHDLGHPDSFWDAVYASALYFNPAIYIDYDSAHSAIHIHGNIYADGFVSAGGVGTGGGSGASELASLTDVVLTSPTDGQVLAYDSASGQWVNRAGGSTTLDWDGISNKPDWINEAGDSKPSYKWDEIKEKPDWIGSTKPSYEWDEIEKKPEWIGSSKPTYTAQEVGALPSDTFIPSDLSDLTDTKGVLNKFLLASAFTGANIAEQLGTDYFVDLESNQDINGAKTFQDDVYVCGALEITRAGCLSIEGATAMQHSNEYIHLACDEEMYVDNDLILANAKGICSLDASGNTRKMFALRADNVLCFGGDDFSGLAYNMVFQTGTAMHFYIGGANPKMRIESFGVTYQVPPRPDGNVNLGFDWAMWNAAFIKRWYPKSSTDVYIEYDSVNEAFKVNGNLYATGYISAGGAGITTPASSVAVINNDYTITGGNGITEYVVASPNLSITLATNPVAGTKFRIYCRYMDTNFYFGNPMCIYHGLQTGENASVFTSSVMSVSDLCNAECANVIDFLFDGSAWNITPLVDIL